MFGCAPKLNLQVEIPEEVRWLGIILLRNGGQLGSTGLIDVPRGSPEFLGLPVVLENDQVAAADQLVAVGYSDADLITSFPPEASILAAGTLSFAAEESPTLPPPTWAAEGSLHASTAVLGPFEAPRLSASWLPTSCDSGDVSRVCGEVPLAAKVSCDGKELACPHGVEQRGCSLVLNLSKCGLGNARGLVESRSSVCLASSGECRGERSVLSCATSAGQCAAEVAPSRPPPSLEVRARIQLFAGVDPTPLIEPLQAGFPLKRGAVASGFVADLGATRARAVVLTSNGESIDPPSRHGVHEPMLAIFLDATSLERTAERLVPGGATLALGHDQAFFIALRDPLGLIRTDEAGVVTASVAYGSIGALTTQDTEPTELLFANSELVLIGRNQSAASGFVAVIDPESLMIKRQIVLPRRGLTTAAIDGSTLFAGDDLANSLFKLDLVELAVSPDLALELADWEWLETFADPVSRGAVFVSTGDSPLLHHFDPRRGMVRKAYFDPAARPTALAPWPGDSESLVVSGVAFSDSKAYAARFSLSEVEFVTSSVELGVGPVRRIVRVGDHDMLALLPWTGEVVRLEAN
jgi:hypothetical protein